MQVRTFPVNVVKVSLVSHNNTSLIRCHWYVSVHADSIYVKVRIGKLIRTLQFLCQLRRRILHIAFFTLCSKYIKVCTTYNVHICVVCYVYVAIMYYVISSALHTSHTGGFPFVLIVINNTDIINNIKASPVIFFTQNVYTRHGTFVAGCTLILQLFPTVVNVQFHQEVFTCYGACQVNIISGQILLPVLCTWHVVLRRCFTHASHMF